MIKTLAESVREVIAISDDQFCPATSVKKETHGSGRAEDGERFIS
jgi:hypothetical protein